MFKALIIITSAFHICKSNWFQASIYISNVNLFWVLQKLLNNLWYDWTVILTWLQNCDKLIYSLPHVGCELYCFVLWFLMTIQNSLPSNMPRSVIFWLRHVKWAADIYNSWGLSWTGPISPFPSLHRLQWKKNYPPAAYKSFLVPRIYFRWEYWSPTCITNHYQLCTFELSHHNSCFITTLTANWLKSAAWTSPFCLPIKFVDW